MKNNIIKSKKIVTLGLTAMMLMGSTCSFWDLSESELNDLAFNDFAVTVYGADLSQFSDTIPQWASSDVSYLVDKGIMQGYPDGTFKPSGTMTRLEFLVATVRSLKTDEEINAIIAEGKQDHPDSDGSTYNPYQMFVDNLNSVYRELGMNVSAEEFWGTPYMFVAQELGIYNAVMIDINDQGAVGYGKNITREEACQIMYLACTKVRGESLPEMKGIQNILNVPEGINIDYDTAVKNCVSNGLIAGIDDNYTIAPKETLTRAQAACILARITDTNRRLAKPVIPEELQQWTQATSQDYKMLTITNPVTGEEKTMTADEWSRFFSENYPSYNGTADGEHSQDGWWVWDATYMNGWVGIDSWNELQEWKASRQ